MQWDVGLFQWRRVLPISVYFMHGSIQRAFFLTVLGGLFSNAFAFANESANAAFALALAFDCHLMAAFALAFAFDSSVFALAFDSNAFD